MGLNFTFLYKILVAHVPQMNEDKHDDHLDHQHHCLHYHEDATYYSPTPNNQTPHCAPAAPDGLHQGCLP